MRGISTRIRGIACAVALLGAVGCTTLTRTHGYVPLDEDLAQITVGVDTSETVAELVGPPTATGVLDDSGFYYVESTFETFGPFAPEEVRREVLAITFDAAGVVRNIERFGLQDGRVVVLSRRVTDDNRGDGTFLRQVLGNFGRVDAETLFGP